MNRLRLFLALLVLAGPVAQRPVIAAARPTADAARSADCPVCGHACCCPDLCREILKARRACAAGAGCRLSAPEPSAFFSAGGAAADPAPTFAVAVERPLAQPDFLNRPVGAGLPDAGRDTPSVPTPPPRA